jgi:hypothetical protein
MKSVDRTPETKKYEAHFASQASETGAMDPIPHGAGMSNTKTPPSGEEDFMDVDKMQTSYRLHNFILQKEVIVIKT